MPTPQLVFNGAVNAVAPTEITSLLTFGGRPLAMLVMSPIMAKTYAGMLTDLVRQYEEMTGISVPTLDEIHARAPAGAGT